MRCPYVSGNYMLSCRALEEEYIPSAFELDEYCKHDLHKMCPFYCKAEACGILNYEDEDTLEQSGSF